MPLDPEQVLGLLLGRGIAGVQQVVDRRLDHVQRIAELVRDAAGDLPEGGQPLGPLKPRRVLVLIGVLDDRQVEIEQLVERADRLLQGCVVALPVILEAADEPCPEPRQRDIGVDLLEPDLDMPPADPPAAGDVVGVVRAGEELAKPLHQRSLEPFDLRLAARDDLARIIVAVDLGVEVVNQRDEARLDQRGGGHQPFGVRFGPTDVGLEFAIAAKPPVRLHFVPSRPPQCHEKSPRTVLRKTVAWALETQPVGPFVSHPVNFSQFYIRTALLGSRR